MKQDLFRQVTALVLVLSVLVCFPLPAHAADGEMTAMLDEQVRDYAASIKQSNTDEAAAWLLARHGITEQGSTLLADETHPVTALLMNSELVQASFAELLTEMLTAAQDHDGVPVYAAGTCAWTTEKTSYGYEVSLNDPSGTDGYASTVSCDPFTGEINGYDTMLRWLAGEVDLEVSLEKSEVRDKTIAYEVRVRFTDHFVFDPNIKTDSISIALLALLTSTMFVEFDWEASTVFELEVPHSCTHRVPNYHWTYDAENDTMTCDTSGDRVSNEARRIPLENGAYYKLERDVVLRHTDPWVLAYSVKNPNTFALSSGETKDDAALFFLNYSRLYLFFACTNADGTGTDYFGTSLTGAFRYNAADTYTIRLENMVADDGSNMVWLTIRNDTQDTVVLENTPMDDHYVIENGFWVRRGSGSGGISGRDFSFRYIGNESYRFDCDAFDLSVWSMGQGADDGSWFTSAVTEPTCEEQGFTTHTCAMCGYSYRDSHTDPLGHSWGEWETVQEATDTESGLRRRGCGHCGGTEEEVIPRLGVLYGDLDGDDRVNTLDLILLRQYLAGWDVAVDTAAADVNGNGSVNTLDLILLRQYLAGWGITLGP